MAVIVIDTDVYSYITASDPRRGLPYKQHLEGHTIALSVITVGEQYAGYLKQISKGKWPTTRLAKLESGLRSVAIIPYDLEVCKTFGDLKAKSERYGQSVAVSDLWIAACAKRHSLRLVTNNRKHYDGIPGLDIVSEAPGKRRP